MINGGFAAGYYPDTYYLYLKNIGLDLDPDLVLLGLFIGNDIDYPTAGENEWTSVDADGLPLSIQNIGSTVDDGGYLVRSNPAGRYRYPVLRNSHLIQLAAAAA